MRQKLRAILLSAFAVTVLAVVPASASATTLTANSVLGIPATNAYFGVDGSWSNTTSMTVDTTFGSYTCDNFFLATTITQNEADPITLDDDVIEIDDTCTTPTGATIEYSDMQLTAPMTLNADGTGALPLRVTENWTSRWGIPYSCVREGVLDVDFDPTNNSSAIALYGGMPVVSGSSCPQASYWYVSIPDGALDEFGGPIEWVVTP